MPVLEEPLRQLPEKLLGLRRKRGLIRARAEGDLVPPRKRARRQSVPDAGKFQSMQNEADLRRPPRANLRRRTESRTHQLRHAVDRRPEALQRPFRVERVDELGVQIAAAADIDRRDPLRPLVEFIYLPLRRRRYSATESARTSSAPSPEGG